jgi:hypothetical protein
VGFWIGIVIRTFINFRDCDEANTDVVRINSLNRFFRVCFAR